MSEQARLLLMLRLVATRVWPLAYALYFASLLAAPGPPDPLLDLGYRATLAVGVLGTAASIMFAISPHTRLTQAPALVVGALVLLGRAVTLALLDGPLPSVLGVVALWVGYVVMIMIGVLTRPLEE